MRNRMLAAALLPAAMLLAPAAWAHDPVAQVEEAEAQEPRVTGLFTTLPIMWGETASIAETLAGSAEQHWARGVLEQGGKLRAVDFIAPEYLADVDLLVMAQPRPLAPSENVALDEWVRGGGRLLLVADPMMTSHSRFGLGDRRRPQDVVLLSPILQRWGIEMLYDEGQPEAAQLLGENIPAEDVGTVRDGDADRGHPKQVAIPVMLPGHFRLAGNGVRACQQSHDNSFLRCRLGTGSITLFGDAAFLDLHEPMPGSDSALAWLLGESRK
ncbi:Gldg family protein [Paraurantiacibacter namhicola]|uniref:ABC-type uncharacterized transport system n=1 Tax=Paraurantiacibacter namhicola TaxID=645517 RepID=A0A1C7DAS9_9SPHN|nr:DUF4350 domain-containing protein [Paraurantiacibacter namhicola]ANU08554.1 ABC-type uncharacterized transport system [Paraurantiacibacter namhicola]